MDPLTPQQAKKLKVTELKDALSARGAPTSGLKPALQQRLLDLLEEEATPAAPNSTDETATEEKMEEEETRAQVVDAAIKTPPTSPKKVVSEPEPTTEKVSATTKQVPENSANVPETPVSTYEAPTQKNIEKIPDTTTPHATPSSLAVEDDDDEVAELRAAEEKKLREEVLRTMAKKKIKPSSPTSETRPPTNHLRVDHFQRPLNPKHLREWITEIASVNLPDNGLWMNAIKTHCYMDFASVDDAVACRNALITRRWPDTNPQTLVAHFVTISATQAPSAPEAALQYVDWVTSQQSGVVPVSARKAESPRVRPTGGAVDMLRNAAGAAAASASSTAENTKTRNNERRLEVAADGGFTTKRAKLNPEGETESSTPRNAFLSRVPSATTPRSARDRQPQTKSLDELFRKTVATPPLYWLPLTEADVAAKKNASSAVRA